jgi:maltooligosyltrehalose trehalohydrolase
MLGERLSALSPFGDLKLAAGAVLLSPFIPLIFMGEEYGETTPFQYFVSHSDAGLIEAVRRGRRREFADFAWVGEIPDPQSEETFSRSILDHDLKWGGRHATLRQFYRELICLRKRMHCLGLLRKETQEVAEHSGEKVLSVRYRGGIDEAISVFNFNRENVSVLLTLSPGRWEKVLDSSEPHWGGPGSITSCVLEFAGQVSISMAGRTLVFFQKRE